MTPSEWETQLKARDQAALDVVEYGRALIDKIREKSPDLILHLSGETVINHSITNISARDAKTLIPIMFLAIIIVLGILLRSGGSIVGTTAVIAMGVISTMGLTGWLGYSLNMVNMAAPIIVLTIAVCDSVHLLSIYLRNLNFGSTPIDAMRESLGANLKPIFITSVTTAVGFLTLNFSESPPFRELGNVCAFGVMYTMILTLFLLPSIVLILVRKQQNRAKTFQLANTYADFIIVHKKLAFVATTVIATATILLIPLNHINDDPALYFKQGTPYRDSVDFSQQTLPGINDINFSISCGAAGCINEPDFLTSLDEFSMWLLGNREIESVVTYTDVIKRINRNMHGEEKGHYRIPENTALSSQYNLLYELSLPYGLDLNNLLNFDKSSTRITAYTKQLSSSKFIELEEQSQQWLAENSVLKSSRGSSIRMMFATLGESNVKGMFWGALFALIGVTLTIVITLRSVKYALISFIPNSFPAAIALGLWGAAVSQVNMAVAAVFSITLGIIVDDSVHFISKYRRARERLNKSAEDSIRYAFSTVGPALVITSIVLSVGFSLLCFSNYILNVYLGALTAMTVIIALIFDFLILPPLLMFFDNEC